MDHTVALYKVWIQDKSVRTRLSYELYGESSIPGIAKTSLLLRNVQTPPIQMVPGTFSLEANRTKREADYSSLSNAEVKDGR
jgi:hypothetical protein